MCSFTHPLLLTHQFVSPLTLAKCGRVLHHHLLSRRRSRSLGLSIVCSSIMAFLGYVTLDLGNPVWERHESPRVSMDDWPSRRVETQVALHDASLSALVFNYRHALDILFLSGRHSGQSLVTSWDGCGCELLIVVSFAQADSVSVPEKFRSGISCNSYIFIF
ncbi:hypothetical protein BDW62DRAFT_159826 [Aspergillus aurantiobrunneus]